MGHNLPTNTYDTLDDLRKAIGQSSSSVKVLGQTTINDEFGGDFYWDNSSTLPDDNLDVIQPLSITTGRWRRVKGNLQQITSGQSNNTTKNSINVTDNEYLPLTAALTLERDPNTNIANVSLRNGLAGIVSTLQLENNKWSIQGISGDNKLSSDSNLLTYSGRISAEGAEAPNELVTLNQVQFFDTYLVPEKFGAIGDGIANDTVAITNFINALEGKTGYLRGQYLIDTIVLGDVQNFELLGIPGQTKILCSSDSKMIEFGNMENITIQGITFENSYNNAIIDFERPMLFCFKKQITNVTIRNCEFTMPNANRAAIAFLSRWVSPFTGGIDGLRIENNYFHDIGMYAVAVGMRDYVGGDQYAQNIYINNNQFENIGLNGEYGFAVTLDGIGRATTVNNNYLYNCYDIGIENTGWNDSEFVGNRFAGFIPGRRWSPMSFSSNTITGNLIQDNRTIETAHSSVSFINVNNSRFISNYFDCSGLTTTFTNLRNSNNNIIDGDTYISANSFALLCQSGASETVTGNRFINCTFDNTAATNNFGPITFEGVGTTGNTLTNCRLLKGTGGFLAFKQLNATENYINHPISTATNNYISTYSTVNIVGDADYTFNAQEDIIRYEYYRINGTITAPRTITIPSVRSRNLIIRNATTQQLIITSGSGGTVTINPSEVNRVISDGTNLFIAGGNVTSVNGSSGPVSLTQDNVPDNIVKRVLVGGNTIGTALSLGTATGSNQVVNVLVNGTIQSTFGSGYFANNSYINSASGNNSRIDLNTTNTTLSDNRADSNPGTVFHRQNVAATGDLVRFMKAGSILSRININGFFQSPSVTTTIDFGSVAANSELAAPATITLVGAATGDCVLIGAPNTVGIVYKGVVTATDTVTLYACNFTTAPIDPASGSFKITIIK